MLRSSFWNSCFPRIPSSSFILWYHQFYGCTDLIAIFKERKKSDHVKDISWCKMLKHEKGHFRFREIWLWIWRFREKCETGHFLSTLGVSKTILLCQLFENYVYQFMYSFELCLAWEVLNKYSTNITFVG